MIINSPLEMIGATPVVRLRSLLPDPSDEIFVKLEGANPSGSIKDRTALFMIEQAELAGRLRPGSTIVESTSGNLGKSLALIGAVKGYRVMLVVDVKTPQAVLSYASSLGAELVMVDEPDDNGSFQTKRVRRVKELLDEVPGAINLDQYNNPDNPRAHTVTTAPEIIQDFPKLDVLIGSVSTGGHLTGTSTVLKDHYSGLHVRAVDAVGSASFGYPFAPYSTRGIGLSWPPKTLRRELVDSLHRVADGEALSACRTLAIEEGVLIGESGGAVIFAALTCAMERPGQSILAIAPDTGANYLEESYNDDWLRARQVDPRDLCRCRDDLLDLAWARRGTAIPVSTMPDGEQVSADAEGMYT